MTATKYVSIEEQLRFDAGKYTARGLAYIQAGQLDRAIGCLNKALKKIKRADALKLSPLEEAIFGSMLTKLSEQIAKGIMEGK